MAKVLVTGGAGFLGSHLCDKLLSLGNEVICIDNLLTGSEKNIAHLKDNPDFTFLKFDCTDPLPSNLKAEEVYHLASPASPNKKSLKSYHNLAFETMAVNTQGTWNVTDFCLKNRAKLLFASTSEVYGDPKEHPQKETYNGNVSTTSPRSIYDESKRFGETIVSAYVRLKGLDGRIVRIFNTYGPRMALDDGRAIMEFTLAALKNEPIPIFGDGKQTRSFCYVSDLIDGLIAVMDKGESGEIYNIGTPKEYTILDLAENVKKYCHSFSQFKYLDLPEGDPLKRKPDITKAKDKLNWEPKVSLDEGLPKFIEYVKNKQ